MRVLRPLSYVGLVMVLLAPSASATPVATTKDEHELYGRVLLEPLQSVDYIQWQDEFVPGMKLMEKLYPKYLDFFSVDEALDDPRAVSIGQDGQPPWHPDDTKDGLPFHIAVVTDESVPDRKKEYVFLTNGHAAEPCGREGDLRFLEDLLIWRTEDPGHKLNDATGNTGKTHEITVKDLLKRTKIYVVDTVPDAWFAGDRVNGGWLNYSNYSNGFNTNRLAFHDGWVFPDHPTLFKNGYTTLTQPESAIVKYFEKVRREELHGRPFAAAADMHGPLPVGAVLLHEQNSSADKLVRIHDFAERIEQKMEEALGGYITPQGVGVYEQVMHEAGGVRDEALKAYTQYIGPVDEKAAYITLEWAEYATIWEHLDYTVTGTWGGWAAADAGLGADSISYEVDCQSFAPYDGRSQQVFVDNIRAIVETTVVHAAHIGDRFKKRDLGGRLGFYESGDRITDRDGNPSPPPRQPRNEVYGMAEQRPYDVSNTDYFRDLGKVVSSPIEEVGDIDDLDGLDSFVVADETVGETSELADFVRSGGTLVLTDSALKMVPELVDVPSKAVKKGYAYVGYSDLDLNHPWTKGLYPRARQTFDPVGLGYPLLMERDQYWPCGNEGGQSQCENSPTFNSAPIWSIQRADWEKTGGVTVGTVDPPKNRKLGAEGQETSKTSIGVVESGKGRIVIFGALLPKPSEDFDHWFGLNPYTITIPGQNMLLNALDAKAKK
ncbi:MAG TPA: hypothetical protein VJ927_03125 [Actinomycetota bacterium]|nr:hypothetical protein [Actinomycetota bacterium]